MISSLFAQLDRENIGELVLEDLEDFLTESPLGNTQPVFGSVGPRYIEYVAVLMGVLFLCSCRPICSGPEHNKVQRGMQ